LFSFQLQVAETFQSKLELAREASEIEVLSDGEDQKPSVIVAEREFNAKDV
jgi:hypothetical protein